MPHSVEGYVHRIGRTGRAYNSGASVSLVSLWDKTNPLFFYYLNSNNVFLVAFLSLLSIGYSVEILNGTNLHNSVIRYCFVLSQVSPDEMYTLEEIRSFVGDDENKGTSSIAEFPLLTKNAVESLRYRTEVIYYFLYS